jgi:hypothetical protein
LSNLATQNTWWHQQLGGLIASGDYSKDAVNHLLSRGIALTTIDPETASVYNKEVKDTPDDKMEAYVKNHFNSTLSNEQQIGLHFMSQNQLNQPVEIIDPVTHEKRTVTSGQWLKMQDLMDVNGQPTEKMVTQNQHITNNDQRASAYTGRLHPEQPRAPGTLSGLNPTTFAAETALGTQQANAIGALNERATSAPQRISNLEKAYDIISSGKLETGPGTEGRNTVRAFVSALGPELTKKFGGDKFNAETANYQEFNKLMTNYANAASSSLGSGTNDRLNAALTGNANVNILNMANKDILARTIAAEKMDVALNKAWSNSNLPPSQFNNFRTKFADQISPEAFAFDAMKPAQRAEYLQRLKADPAKYNQFAKGLRDMVDLGYIKAPGK